MLVYILYGFNEHIAESIISSLDDLLAIAAKSGSDLQEMKDDNG